MECVKCKAKDNLEPLYYKTGIDLGENAIYEELKIYLCPKCYYRYS